MYMGIDPGASGGIALLDSDHQLSIWKMPETEGDIAELIDSLAPSVTFCLIESVHSLPKQGVKSTFSFGCNYGFLRGRLIGKIPFDDVPPGTWQRAMRCLSRGDKNVTKAKAQQLFPSHKITHAVADAALIAEYCFRLRKGMLGNDEPRD